MVELLDDILRKNPIGTWKAMPIPKEPEWDKTSPSDHPGTQSRWLGKGRISLADVSWRVSTRKELLDYYNGVMKSTYKNLAIVGISLVAALYSFSMFASSKDVVFAVLALIFASLVSRHYTKAWGGYAGGWSDYEHDPVQVAPHNAYVLNKGFGMM
ncbi:MAG: hypothetical protein V1717_02870 [Candidatus Micrarchaeota archaeon]